MRQGPERHRNIYTEIEADREGQAWAEACRRMTGEWPGTRPALERLEKLKDYILAGQSEG